MKIKSLIFTLFVAMVLVACDVIPQEDRLEDVQIKPSQRTVLLVEFTGNRCVNCPGAAMVASEMLDIAPENVVVVGMHPDGITYTDPMVANIDFRSKEAMDYLSFYGGSISTGLPVGVVNGFNYAESNAKGEKEKKDYLLGSSVWTAKVFEQRDIAPKCLIELSHVKEGDNHTVTAVLKPQESDTISVSLQFWLVESGIVAPQSISSSLKSSYLEKYPDADMGHSSVNNYVHNHVFRGTLNGLWGEELGKLESVNCPNCGPVLPTKSCTFTVDSKYVVDNCSVVAVLINTETKEVVQAAEIALGENSKH